MRVLYSVIRREFASYFATSLAVIFLVVFLGAAGALTFEIGGFLRRGQADLSGFFGFHPWLYLVLMPAIGMRLWAEERRTGTIELLMTLSVSTWQAVTGKFIAAWLFSGLGLALTFPIWITVNILGEPDNGVILASYVGSFLMGGGFLALACCISALTSNQISAFVLGVTAGFVMLLASLDPITAALKGWASPAVVDVVSSLSFAKHFEAISRGVLDLRDVIFFVSFIVLMLFLNVLVLNRHKAFGPMRADNVRWVRPELLSGIGAALGVVFFVAINAFATTALVDARIDLTERQLYELSPTTRGILEAIDEPITLRLYRSPALIASVPSLQVHDRRVNELLDGFVRLAQNKLRVVTVDVEPFSPEEDEALGYQLQGVPLGESGDRGYFGLVGTNMVDSLEAIPFLAPGRDDLLQYDLARLVYRLAELKEPVVSVVDDIGMFGSMEEGRRPWAILDLIGANFTVQRIGTQATAIPDNTDVLIVVHPVRPVPSLLYAIDQFALKGGPVLLFVDPLAETSPPSPTNPAVPLEPGSSLEPLMSAWGVSMDSGKIVGDRDMAIQTIGTAGGQRVVAPYLPWLRVDRRALDPDDLITSQLEIMRMSTAGALVPVAGAGTKVSPLIQSSANSMLLEQTQVIRRVDPNVYLSNFAASGVRQNLAVRISGPARSAYTGGQPPDGVEASGTPLAEGEISAIVVADADMLADSHVVDKQGQFNSNNSDFVLNAIEALAGGDVLAGIRAGGIAYRPFTLIDAMQVDAEQTYRSTEQRLSAELEQVQAQLTSLQNATQGGAGGDPIVASREQRQAIAESNARLVELRTQLRDVRAALRRDIERLENWLKFLNIALVPLLLAAVTALLAGWRRFRLGRYRRKIQMGRG